MTFAAAKMLTGDCNNCMSLIFAISVASMVMAHQASLFDSIMGARRARSRTCATRR